MITADTFFLVLLAVLVVTITLTMWKGSGRGRYVVGALLVLAGVVASMARREQRRQTSEMRDERDELEAQLELRDEQVRRACRRGVSQLQNVEGQLKSSIGDKFNMAGSLLFFGEPLFNMCGVEVDRFDAVTESDPEKQLARVRALREALEHWETD